MKILPVVLLSFVFIAITNGCKKYEEGPVISLRSKEARLVNSWKFDEIVFEGETNLTKSSLVTQAYVNVVEFKKDNTFMFKLNETVLAEGNWSFNKHKTAIELSYTSTFSNNSTERLQILKLKSADFWFIDNGNGDETEFRCTPNQ